MLIEYGVANLRRLKRTPQIALKPITILVGRNSAGKSTYLRSLPLLKQSLVTRTSAPILWYGDYVDFGDFKSAVTDGNTENEISFSFSLDHLRGRPRARGRDFQYLSDRRQVLDVSKVTVTYCVGTYADKTVLNSISLEVPEEKISSTVSLRLGRGETNFLVNGTSILSLLKGVEIIPLEGKIFSVPYFVSRTKDDDSGRRLLYPLDIAKAYLMKLLTERLLRTLAEKTIEAEVRRILLAPKLNEEILLSWSAATATNGIKRLYSELAENPLSEFSRAVSTGRCFARTMLILDALEERLLNYFTNVTYLGPARARSERFYRKQELEVSEIAPDGQNFPMFLASLSADRLQRFSNYVETIFGYGVCVQNLEGHISIELKAGAHKVNVADTGYGVSQLLPVLGQIWWALEKPPTHPIQTIYSDGPSILAIEQPELHLHPAHQALLADVFSRAASNDPPASNRVHLVVETHSEALINRLGELIEAKELSADAVQIVVFSAQDDIHSPTEVEVAKFNEKGALVNWPFGFFNYN